MSQQNNQIDNKWDDCMRRNIARRLNRMDVMNPPKTEMNNIHTVLLMIDEESMITMTKEKQTQQQQRTETKQPTQEMMRKELNREMKNNENKRDNTWMCFDEA